MEKLIREAIKAHAEENYPEIKSGPYENRINYHGLWITYSAMVVIMDYDYDDTYGPYETYRTEVDIDSIIIECVETYEVDNIQTSEAMELRSWARKANKVNCLIH